MPRGRVLRAAKIAFAVAVAIAIAAALVSQWGELREAAASARPSWGYIALSCALVLANYALLIQAWRVLLAGWGSSLGFWQSARVWTISNLGRYIPGKVWAIGSLAVMAQARGVSGAAAVGAALLGSLINTVAGFIVLAATGAGVLELPTAAVVAIALLGAAILVAPPFLPWLGRVAGRLARRDITIPRIPHRAIWIAAAISALSWILYGVAFRVLTVGVLSRAPGELGLYTAIWTGSYLAGFLAVFAPGGVGVREVVMAGALKAVSFGTGEAILLVVASRVWLTVLEILPAALFLIIRPMRREKADAPPEVASDAR
ncbi:MAG TPA: lysylphosphatidylglycerol synthase domain-containing protein [Gemmatimonadaceae bacterium]|nr:lysylphosphatidylglycerol synthase domain-containing protein [Gemmatimonadaceae bacterium]